MFDKLKIVVLLTASMFVFTSSAAQRGERGGRQNHPEPPRHEQPREPRKPEGNHAREHSRDGRAYSRDEHRHIGRQEIRIRRGYEEIFFGGYWFGCTSGTYPEWVFTEDVYIEMVGPDVYVIHPYYNPAVGIFIFIAE